MSLFLTILALAAAAAAFFYPLPESFVVPLRISVLGLLGLSVLTDIVVRVRRRRREADRLPAPRTEAPAPPAQAAEEAAVVQFLARLQEKGRLVDFAMDDVTPYTNEQIGAAARVVHQGCREVLQESFRVEPVHAGEERETVTLSEDYDAGAYRLVGKVPEAPPYRGTVLHRGWRTTTVKLPRVTEAARPSAREIIAPAEVEID